MFLRRFSSMKLLILLLLVSSCSLSEADIENDLEANIIGDFEEEGNVPENPDRRDCDFEKDASDLYIRTVSVTATSFRIFAPIKSSAN